MNIQHRQQCPMAIWNTKTIKWVDALNEVYQRCKRLTQGVTIINTGSYGKLKLKAMPY